MNPRRAEFGTLADICKGFHALQSALRKRGEHISIKTVDRPVYQLFEGLTPTNPPEGDNVHSVVKGMYGLFTRAEVGLQQLAAIQQRMLGATV